jgi:GT2 family glycosyltransferase
MNPAAAATVSVTAVIPNYNGQRLLHRYLPAVISCLRHQDELLIVDDASRDTSVDWLVENYHLQPAETTSRFWQWLGSTTHANKTVHIKVLKNKHNLRFGESCNLGVKEASGDLIFLLNNDVKPKPDVLRFLLPYFKDQKVFAVGCAELEPLSPRSTEYRLGGKNRLLFEKGMLLHSRATSFESGETAWVSGGSGLFDRQKWLELDGFDRAYYPAYWEDVDLSFRARQRGWSVLFERQAEVEHHHETTNQTTFGQRLIFEMSWRSAQTFLWKNGTSAQKLANILWKPYHWYYWWRSVIK